MKSIVLKIAFCFSVLLFLSTYKSYKTYEFDYIIEYKNLIGKNKTVFYLTNSKDNQYFALLSGVSRDTINLRFYKHNTIKINQKIHKKEFYNSETIDIEKPKGHYSSNIYLSKTDGFSNLSDTIISDNAYKRYLFSTIHDLKIHYTIEPNTEFHLPILTGGKIFKSWNKDKSIPNGVFKEMYFEDEYGKIVEAHYQLVEYQPYKKSIRVKF